MHLIEYVNKSIAYKGTIRQVTDSPTKFFNFVGK